jgi:hypothetical protein
MLLLFPISRACIMNNTVHQVSMEFRKCYCIEIKLYGRLDVHDLDWVSWEHRVKQPVDMIRPLYVMVAACHSWLHHTILFHACAQALPVDPLLCLAGVQVGSTRKWDRVPVALIKLDRIKKHNVGWRKQPFILTKSEKAPRATGRMPQSVPMKHRSVNLNKGASAAAVLVFIKQWKTLVQFRRKYIRPRWG